MQQQEWKFGAHVVRSEPPDLAYATFSGPISLEEIQRVVELYRELSQSGIHYLICDIGRSQISNEARQYLTENSRPDWFRGVVYVGADILQKTFTKVITLSMLFTGKTPLEVGFKDTVPEAREWVQQQRLKFQAKTG